MKTILIGTFVLLVLVGVILCFSLQTVNFNVDSPAPVPANEPPAITYQAPALVGTPPSPLGLEIPVPSRPPAP